MEKGFTLVIPLYNKRAAIKYTLDSVLINHGEYPFKCIVVDDDSDDGSSEIALEYDRNYPDVFSYIKRTHHERKTPSFARNVGINLAETEYIGFLDADDELCAGFIDRGCNFLDEHPEYSLYGNNNINHYVNENGDSWCDAEYSENNNQIVLTNFLDYYLSNQFNHFGANIYRTNLVKSNLFTDVFSEDVVFLCKYIYKNEPVYIDKSINQTIIWHSEYKGSSWNIQRTDTMPIAEIMNTVKNEIPDFKYGFYINENNDLLIYPIK